MLFGRRCPCSPRTQRDGSLASVTQTSLDVAMPTAEVSQLVLFPQKKKSRMVNAGSCHKDILEPRSHSQNSHFVHLWSLEILRPENRLGAFGFFAVQVMLGDYFNAQGLGNRTRLLRVRKGRSDLESESLQSQVNVIYPYFWKGVGSCGPWVSRTSFLVPTLLWERFPGRKSAPWIDPGE